MNDTDLKYHCSSHNFDVYFREDKGWVFSYKPSQNYEVLHLLQAKTFGAACKEADANCERLVVEIQSRHNNYLNAATDAALYLQSENTVYQGTPKPQSWSPVVEPALELNVALLQIEGKDRQIADLETELNQLRVLRQELEKSAKADKAAYEILLKKHEYILREDTELTKERDQLREAFDECDRQRRSNQSLLFIISKTFEQTSSVLSQSYSFLSRAHRELRKEVEAQEERDAMVSNSEPPTP